MTWEMRSRPMASRAANQEGSAENFNGTSTIPNRADVRLNRDGVQVVDRDGMQQLSQSWQCRCGCQCVQCGLLTLEDRHAAFSAGYESGVAAGRLQNVADEIAALTEASALLEWIKVRTLAAAADGEVWAATVAGPKPGGDLNV